MAIRSWFEEIEGVLAREKRGKRKLFLASRSRRGSTSGIRKPAVRWNAAADVSKHKRRFDKQSRTRCNLAAAPR